ncbi:MAG: hypothetical protein JCHSAcid_12650 [uncultured Acidilobus sp. JCHS]|nr:MAG: hypothetical protein JCHSAcid_12650 [uncultured Acidilobus sp. JCHS]
MNSAFSGLSLFLYFNGRGQPKLNAEVTLWHQLAVQGLNYA